MKKLTLACALSLFAFSALAQRTFVSVSGLDTNPCSPTQPCRTIQQALNAVAAGGDVIMMDTAGFGNALSINKGVKAGPGQTSPPLRVYVDDTKIFGAVVGVKLDAGSFIMGQPSIIAFSSQDAYIIDSKVPNCSGIGGLLYYNVSPASRSRVTRAPAIRKTFATA
jgi:hypothetical protein